MSVILNNSDNRILTGQDLVSALCFSAVRISVCNVAQSINYEIMKQKQSEFEMNAKKILGFKPLSVENARHRKQLFLNIR